MAQLKDVFNYANNAITRIVDSITFDDTEITLENGTIFPAASAGRIFHMTLSNSTKTLREIVKVTERIGNVCTVVRAQEGTTALNWPAETAIENLYTKAMADSSVQAYPNRQVLFDGDALASPIGDPILAADGSVQYPGDGGIALAPASGEHLNSPTGDPIADATGALLYKSGAVLGHPDGMLAMGLEDPPATPTSPGEAGMITYDSDALHVCTAPNTWKAIAYDSSPQFIRINHLTEGRTLLVAESGQLFSNNGAVAVVEVTLPGDEAPEGTNYKIISAVYNVGIRINRPGEGVFISYNGGMGVSFSSYTKGSSCLVVKVTESEWMILEASPSAAWVMQAPVEQDYSPEILAWLAAVRVQLGEPLQETLVIYDQHIHSLNYFGIWPKIVDIAAVWKQAEEAEPVALVSLKLNLLSVLYNAPWPTAGQGYTLDGETQWVLFPCIPSVHGPGIMTTTNQRIEAYNVLAYGENAHTLSTPGASIRPLQNGVMYVSFGDQTAGFPLVENIGGGHIAGSREGTGTIYGYKDGEQLGITTGLTMSSTLSTFPFIIGARNIGGVPSQFLNSIASYFAVGARLTAEEEAHNHRLLNRLVAYYRAQVIDPNEDPED
jgi:hypothetical protein